MTALDSAALRADPTAANGEQDRRAEIYRSAARIFHRKGYHALRSTTSPPRSG